MSRLAAPKPFDTAPDAAAALELLKPITWFPPMWAFACGVASAAAPGPIPWLSIVLGVLLCGPIVCGGSQAVNDWFDRDVDALNEPRRPIPSGRIPGRWGLYIAIGTTALGAVAALPLGSFVFGATLIALLFSWMYSAPPIRLKSNGWWGNSVVAACYEGLPWLTGATVVAGVTPAARVIVIAALYSIGAHGIMTLNDFKSVAGDRRMRVRSLPVQLGVERAARLACWIMALAQAAVILLLLLWQRAPYACAVAALLLAQLILMRRLLRRPRELAPWYNGTGVSLYVLGMLAAALALRGPNP